VEGKPAPAKLMLKVTVLAPTLILGLSAIGCWPMAAESAKRVSWCQVEPLEISDEETYTSMTTWATPDQTLGVKPLRFMIWMFQLLAVVTLTWREWFP
jgi:hypothetical protein